MLKEVRVKCPGCQKEFVVDIRTGKVIRELDRKAGGEELFDGALDKVREQAKDTEHRFDRVMESQEGRLSRLEEAFDEARKRAAENPDEKPYNPLDWD